MHYINSCSIYSVTYWRNCSIPAGRCPCPRHSWIQW